MRLVTFAHAGRESVGAWIHDDREILDLAAAAQSVHGASGPEFGSMLALIEAGPAAWERARALVETAPRTATIATGDCQLRAPLPRPTQIRDCLCFPAHLEGCRRVVAEQMIGAAPDPAKRRTELEAAGFTAVPKDYFNFPVYYISNRMSVVGPDVDVRWPSFSSFIDYELEWAAVIGRAGTGIAKENAREHIFGYSIFNDWSARDEQMKVMGATFSLGPGQGKDFANALGPCIVTADEISDPYSLAMVARVNGVEVSRGSTAGMHFRFEDLIEYVSRGHSIEPGELFCSGTVGGGCSFETGQRLAPGDVVELEVERIGRLRNRVVAPHLAQADGTTGEMLANMSSVMKIRASS